MLGVSKIDEAINVVSELEHLRLKKAEIDSEVAAAKVAEKDENNADGGGRIVKLIRMGYTNFEAAEVVRAPRLQKEAKAASLAERAAAIKNVLRPHLLECGLKESVADQLIKDLSVHPIKHVGCHCTQTNENPIIGKKYIKLPDARHQHIREAKEKLERAKRYLHKVEMDKTAGSGRRSEARDVVSQIRQEVSRVQAITARYWTVRQTAFAGDECLCENAYKQLDQEQRRKYTAVARPDLEAAVQHYVAASAPLKLEAEVASLLFELEDENGIDPFELMINERPPDPEIRQFIVEWREMMEAKVHRWRMQLASTQFKLQQSKQNLLRASDALDRRRDQKAHSMETARQHPPLRFVQRTDRVFPVQPWDELTVEQQEDYALLGFTEDSWPATALEQFTAQDDRQPLLTGENSMHDEAIDIRKGDVETRKRQTRQIGQSADRLSKNKTSFRWLERAMLHAC
eukprot:SAG31_NODE_2324_length_5941_cov_1.960801_1_plen_459_part_10